LALVGGRSIAISVSVCLSVCLFARISQKHVSKFRHIFWTGYLWPWLLSSLATTQYVMYFRFCGWRCVFT